jgi:hypothetical protein
MPGKPTLQIKGANSGRAGGFGIWFRAHKGAAASGLCARQKEVNALPGEGLRPVLCLCSDVRPVAGAAIPSTSDRPRWSTR